MHAQPHVEVLYINILVRSSLPLTPQQKTFLGSHFCNTTQYKNQRWQTTQTSIFQPSVLFLIWRQLLKYTCRLIVLMTGVLQKLPVTLDRFKFSDSYGYLSFLWPWKANAWPYKGILTNVKVWKYRYRHGFNWGSFSRACSRPAECHSSIARIWYVSYKNKQISWTMKRDDFKCQLRLATCGWGGGHYLNLTCTDWDL